jgi:hypothetical protein
VLVLAFAVFISLFALDVFETGAGLWETLAAFLIHMIPTAIVLVFAALAWRWEWIGAAVFLGLGIFYLVATGGREHWAAYVTISGPLFLLAVLFGTGWLLRKELRPRV